MKRVAPPSPAAAPVVCFEGIRERCREVACRSRSVRIDESALRSLARDLAIRRPPDGIPDPARRFRGDAGTTLAFVVTLDAINFGSGWFPLLTKRPGLSGYFTIATSLQEHFERVGPFSAAELAGLRAGDCARLFGQDRNEAATSDLMELFAQALRDLGGFLLTRWEGRFEGLVEQASGSAAVLAGLLATMPFYRDVSPYEELDVPFFKRAQITVADLHGAFQGSGPGRFADLDQLTLFADNLVPHVLRVERVLVYDAALLRRIEAGDLLPAGSPEEVEIRACAVHAVELLAAEIRSLGGQYPARYLDQLLWTRGQQPGIKAHPRHRTRTVYY